MEVDVGGVFHGYYQAFIAVNGVPIPLRSFGPSSSFHRLLVPISFLSVIVWPLSSVSGWQLVVPCSIRCLGSAHL
jgi:hypothetical protein